MTLTTPNWLAKRGCTLREGYDRRSWFVCFDTGPQYRLVPVPASGKYSCEVTQTVNGRRLDKGATYPTQEEALWGGLEDLRQALAW